MWFFLKREKLKTNRTLLYENISCWNLFDNMFLIAYGYSKTMDMLKGTFVYGPWSFHLITGM